MPGLVDGHAHAGHGLIKTMGGGRSDLWYEACQLAYTVGSTPDFWRAEAQLAALERLRFGVTTGVSLLGGGDSIMRTDEPVYGDAHCDGVLGVGTRSVVAIGPTRPPHPRTYARWNGGTKHEFPVTFRTADGDLPDPDRHLARHAWQPRPHRDADTDLAGEHRTELGGPMLDEAIRQAVEARRFSRERGLVFTQDGHTDGQRRSSPTTSAFSGPTPSCRIRRG